MRFEFSNPYDGGFMEVPNLPYTMGFDFSDYMTVGLTGI